jgi:hypothetical protein
MSERALLIAAAVLGAICTLMAIASIRHGLRENVLPEPEPAEEVYPDDYNRRLFRD